MIRLYQGSTIEDFWSGLLDVWMHSASGSAWSQPKPVVILTPSQAKAQSIRAALLRARLPILGVEFWQPSDARAFLGKVLGVGALPVSDNHLIAAGIRTIALDMAAEQPDNATARAVSRSAQALADTLAMLEASGWGHEQIQAEPLKTVAARFVSARTAGGITTEGVFDFEILKRARSRDGDTQFAGVLVAGFDGMHWEAWPLLAAAALLADDAVVTLPLAYESAGEADMVWCSSWEQLAGSEIVPLSDANSGHTALTRLGDHMDMRMRGAICDASSVPIEFAASATLVEEARAVALRAAKLASDGSGSVGILVPGYGVLAREVSLALERAGIEHYTTLPGYAAPVPHAGSWAALLQAFVDGTADALCTFLRTNGDLPDAFTQGVGSRRLADRLDRLATETMASDIGVLRGWLAAASDELSESGLREFLDRWPTLPESAPLGSYLERIQNLLTELGWTELALSVADARREHKTALALNLSRDAACEWLRLALPGRRAFRTDFNGSPYAKIQIMTPSDAVWRTWEHLIFAGQTDGAWPPPLKPAGYLGEEAVRRLNQQARSLNELATEMGEFGEGMTVVRPDKGFCVGPLDQRWMHVRDLVRLLHATARSVTFSCSLTDESDSGRQLHPGDFYRRAYVAVRGDTLDIDGLREIGKTIEVPTWMVMPKAVDVDASNVRRAWDARNHGDVLTEYEFTLGSQQPARIPNIPPSAWGKAFDAPAEVFLDAYVGVRPPKDSRRLAERAAQGIWAHHFVEYAAKTATPGAADEWEAKALEAAMAQLDRMKSAMASQGRSVPAWWRSALAQSNGHARHFAREAGKHSGGRVIVSERRIRDLKVTLPSGRRLHVGGRLDLQMSDRLPDGIGLSGSHQVWDFKTGSDKPLNGIKSLVRFVGIPLALYVLALKQLGAANVQAGLVTENESWSPQLTCEDLASDEAGAVLERIARMQDEGLFGWTGIVRDAYSKGCAYPLATVAPVVSIIAKFRKTHDL